MRTNRRVHLITGRRFLQNSFCVEPKCGFSKWCSSIIGNWLVHLTFAAGMVGSALPPDVRRGSASPYSSVLPLGSAPRFGLCPYKTLLRSNLPVRPTYGAEPAPGAKPNSYLLAYGEAEPGLTSSGKAEVNEPRLPSGGKAELNERPSGEMYFRLYDGQLRDGI
jgi:hypothetical protein